MGAPLWKVTNETERLIRKPQIRHITVHQKAKQTFSLIFAPFKGRNI